MKTEKHIYRVSFREPPVGGDPGTDFYFSSMKAIYDLFTPGQIGCGARRLSRVRVPQGRVYESRTARVSREPLHSKAQTNPNPKPRRRAAESPGTANENEPLKTE